MATSRPTSLALMPLASASLNPASPPSLRDILSDVAPPPFTLGAFTAFLSQNFCLETLEFTLDAERYTAAYLNYLKERAAGSGDGKENVCAIWRKIISAYILPQGHREVNIPAHVRDRLLSLATAPVPPDPSELDEAVRIVYELLNDSVLGPFLASASAQQAQQCEQTRCEANDSRHARSRLRIPRESSSASEDSTRSPRSGLLPLLTIPWTSEPKSAASSSSDAADRGGLTDDSTNTPSPTGNEPMTPPTTPPTSDYGFSSSPGGLQKVVGSHSSGWKKMGARLGFNRMSRSKRGHSASASSVTSVPASVDVPGSPPKTATPAAPKQAAESEKSQADIQMHCISAEWEEPHPGQRCSVAVLGNAHLSAANCIYSCNGISKVGMAAKAYHTPYSAQRWSAGARRFAPPRLRTPQVRRLKTAQDATAERTSFQTSRSNTSSTVPMLACSGMQTPATSPLSGCVPGNNSTSFNITGDSRDPASCSSGDCPSMTLTDFSGFLKSGLSTVTTTSANDDSLMSVDVECSPQLTPDPDPYGWESELDKRLCSVMQYRRAGGTKRTLLRRVLSLGPKE
ncbi:uncharacterized protein B0T15DRAFT_558234 [Chaetomium strumarium]|uniref:RGS domain-containing protein n=1 Tax=Chaetomium strumarium TaxID=1170767 RepID=A0AAJ0GQY6_9PEZI|nr:hypothetical protein B0T15DRAFT_558234 [Chaetomium strumarium]